MAAGLFVLANLPTVAARTAVVPRHSILPRHFPPRIWHAPPNSCRTSGLNVNRHLQPFFVAGVPATLFYIVGPVLTGVVVAPLGVLRDFSGSRNFGAVHVIEAHKCGHHQAEKLESWKGLPELGTNGDLLILLSRDWWIRLHGSVVDLKAGSR